MYKSVELFCTQRTPKPLLVAYMLLHIYMFICTLYVSTFLSSAGLVKLLGSRFQCDNAVGALGKWDSSQFIPTLQLSGVSAMQTRLKKEQLCAHFSCLFFQS